MPHLRAAEPVHYLTPRERQILALLIRDIATKEIAYRLDVNHGTISNLITGLYDKLGVDSRVGLLLWSLQNQRDVERGIVCRVGLHEASCACDFCALHLRRIAYWEP
jgi:DNA-binding CsgD family transcriptional regulator